MSGTGTLPPGYHDRIAAVDRDHWWHRGMRATAFELLRSQDLRRGALLDVGCGTGRFLAAARSRGFAPLAGVEPVEAAAVAARVQVPEADIRVASSSAIPFPDGTFAVVACLDVLQHVEADELVRSLRELRRVVAPDGALVLRTSGAWHHREERSDWRCFEPRTLRQLVEGGGFRCVRLSFANALGSAAARIRGIEPHAPTTTTDGVPTSASGRGSMRYGILRLEGALVSRTPVRMPYGHTIVALAVPG